MLLKRVAGGIASYVPGFTALTFRGTGGSSSARYCYAIWFRHLLLALANGMTEIPRSVAELGPGDSLGAGLCALLSGAERYVGLDRTVHANAQRNLEVFEELVTMFRDRSAIPADAEFPQVWPLLEDTAFPARLLTPDRLERALEPGRIEAIRRALREPNRADAMLRYVAPWSAVGVIERDSMDFVFSQAVFEHVDDIDDAHRAVHAWLKPGAIASHTVDFRCHGMEPRWNAQWTYSPTIWKLMQGRRPWRLNRRPVSAHVRVVNAAGFDLLCERRRTAVSAVRRDELTPSLRAMPESDLTTDSATLVVRKR